MIVPYESMHQPSHGQDEQGWQELIDAEIRAVMLSRAV
jgi:hypothetical protein